MLQKLLACVSLRVSLSRHCAGPDCKQSVNRLKAGPVYRGAIAPLKPTKVTFFHHDFVRFGKKLDC